LKDTANLPVGSNRHPLKFLPLVSTFSKVKDQNDLDAEARSLCFSTLPTESILIAHLVDNNSTAVLSEGRLPSGKSVIHGTFTHGGDSSIRYKSPPEWSRTNRFPS
jgi:hypothetical protein